MNKKIITTVSDIHGRDTWRNVSKLIQNPDNHLVFVGDYTDSFHLTDQQIYDELEAIIFLKTCFKDQVTLLVGNHDIQYIFKDYYCSGYRKSMSEGLYKLFNNNKDLFQLTYQLGDYIWSHAGISTHWAISFLKRYNKYYNTKCGYDDLTTIMNAMFALRYQNPIGEQGLIVEMLFSVSEVRGGQRYDISGPVWADLKETKDDFISNHHQIIGHTPVEFIATVGNKKNSITYTDCHRDRPDFLTKIIYYE